MNYRYKGSTPVKRGQYVELIIGDEEWLRTKVVEPLATQFVVKINGYDRFFFYSDENVTWRKAE